MLVLGALRSPPGAAQARIGKPGAAFEIAKMRRIGRAGTIGLRPVELKALPRVSGFALETSKLDGRREVQSMLGLGGS
jgi:hypothetical protein